MCNHNQILNLYPFENYQLDYSVFIFCSQSCKLHSFPKLLKSGDLSEVVLNICNIIRLFSQILYSILDVKMFFCTMHTLIHFICCNILRILTNMQCHLFNITSYRQFHCPTTYSMPAEENGNPLQYPCLGNPMDRGAWQDIVHGVPKSQTRLSDFIFTFSFTPNTQHNG